MSSYDYVIVGAGSAGCALAGRLSEEKHLRIALVEAGGWDSNPWIHVPVGYYRTAFNPDLNWGYETEPDPGLGGRRNSWPRGKVIGGCSSINGLVYIRGQSEDFRRWRRQGAIGWDWEDMLPYFRRMENQENGESELHGVGGPLDVANIREKNPLMQAYTDAAEQAGISRTDDFNGKIQDGVGYYQLVLRNRRRCSAATAYLRPARNRSSLDILTQSHTRRVLFEGKRAMGIEIESPSGRQRISARRAVVLCSGAINTPQLLELSGIGNPEILRAFGIDPLIARPSVGENLQDHLQVKTVFQSKKNVTINDRMKNPFKLGLSGLDYLLRGRGLMTVGAAQIGIFARVLSSSTTPDVQFHVMPGSASDPRKGMDAFSAFTATICQLRPESRGHLHIKSPDPHSHPKIFANYLDAEIDRTTVIAALKLSREIVQQPALSQYFDGEKYPGKDVNSDEALLNWAREVGTTIYHPSGTARMGSDEDAVVDPELRVRGVEGLRVADASIMPTLLSGNTNAACMAMGEKLADLLKHEEKL